MAPIRSPKEQELRKRVLRMLDSDLRIEDLTRLLLWARDRPGCPGSVRELGDFVAHADERKKGLSTERAGEFFSFVRFFMPRIGRPIDVVDVPKDFPSAMRGALARCHINTMWKKLHLRPKQAREILDVILQTYEPNGNSALRQSRMFTDQEMNLLKFLLSYINITPLMDSESLFRDFHAVLIGGGIMEHRELRNFRHVRGWLSLFAIAVMHGTSIILADGYEIKLLAGAMEGTLTVTAGGEVQSGIRGSYQMGVPFFGTDMKPEDWCDPELINARPKGFSWNVPIEMSREGRIVPLR